MTSWVGALAVALGSTMTPLPLLWLKAAAKALVALMQGIKPCLKLVCLIHSLDAGKSRGKTWGLGDQKQSIPKQALSVKWAIMAPPVGERKKRRTSLLRSNFQMPFSSLSISILELFSFLGPLTIVIIIIICY